MRSLVKSQGWTFGIRPESLTLTPDPDHEKVYSFDLEGRPISWFENDCLYKRSLSSEVHGREQFHGGRRRWKVPRDEAAEMFSRMLLLVAGAPTEGVGGDIRARLETITGWTPERLLAERNRFEAAYRPISILPPDQYLAIVLQATFGCSWNRCTFCDFFQGRPFSARPLEEFREHAAAVKELLGRADALRKWIFLADGNALILSNDRLEPIFEIARSEFPGRAISGFVDVFTGERKSREDWEALRAIGLERVHVGLETGHDPLLAWMNKPGGSEDALDLLRGLKGAGLSVSTILMCGVGGDRFAASHVTDTLALLRRLPLTAGDIVYLSPFVEHTASPYARKAVEEGVRALSESQVEQQFARLREEVLRVHPAVRAARYDIREFVY